MILILLFLFPAGAARPATASTIHLILHRALFVEGPDNSQPSGLALCNGSLLAVSDRHDDTVFSVRIGPEAAWLEPYVTFTAPRRGWRRLDFEGIACDEEGRLFLVSETRCRILQLSADGRHAAWITPDLKPYGREKGLFQVDNAYLEGIACLAPRRFVLCAERQPRGFVEVDLSTAPARVSAYTAEAGLFPFAAGRSPDFSDLTLFRDTLYVLERNAFVITRLERRGERWEASAGWSYAHVVEQPEFRYADMRYGKAEGLCMDERFVYLILDNNGIPRAADPEDRRPLLLIFHRPETD
jgi:hypothetical protein